MTIAWTEINPVIVKVFSDMVRADGAPEWMAEWKEAPHQFISPAQQGALYLKVTSCAAIGEDESRYEERTVIVDGDPVQQLYEVICGNRRFNLRVEAWTTEHTDGVWAMQTLERIRTRLFRNSVCAQLLDVGVVVSDYGASTKASANYDKRVWSIGFLDVTMTTTVNEADDDVPVGWIERVILSSHIKNNDGEELPAPPNTTDETLPPI